MKGIYKYCIDDDDVDRLDVILEYCPITMAIRNLLVYSTQYSAVP